MRNVESGQKTVLNAYGAIGPEEFFAVAAEAFFEKPAALKDEDPAVYQQLAGPFLLIWQLGHNFARPMIGGASDRPGFRIIVMAKERWGAKGGRAWAMNTQGPARKAR